MPKLRKNRFLFTKTFVRVHQQSTFLATVTLNLIVTIHKQLLLLRTPSFCLLSKLRNTKKRGSKNGKKMSTVTLNQLELFYHQKSKSNFKSEILNSMKMTTQMSFFHSSLILMIQFALLKIKCIYYQLWYTACKKYSSKEYFHSKSNNFDDLANYIQMIVIKYQFGSAINKEREKLKLKTQNCLKQNNNNQHQQQHNNNNNNS